MPIHSDFKPIKDNFLKRYKDRGEEVYHRWLNRYGLDDTQAATGQNAPPGKKKKSEAPQPSLNDTEFNRLSTLVDKVKTEPMSEEEYREMNALADKAWPKYEKGDSPPHECNDKCGCDCRGKECTCDCWCDALPLRVYEPVPLAKKEGKTVCDNCLTAVYDSDSSITDKEVQIQIAIDLGADLPDHICEDKENCLCTCHPRAKEEDEGICKCGHNQSNHAASIESFGLAKGHGKCLLCEPGKCDKFKWIDDTGVKEEKLQASVDLNPDGTCKKHGAIGCDFCGENAMERQSEYNYDHYKAEEKKYADPKNQKYPIGDYEHTRAAISYFSMPRNYEKYSVEERKAIWGRIKSAAKKFGIEISDTKKFEDECFTEEAIKIPSKKKYENIDWTQIHDFTVGGPNIAEDECWGCGKALDDPIHNVYGLPSREVKYEAKWGDYPTAPGYKRRFMPRDPDEKGGGWYNCERRLQQKGYSTREARNICGGTKEKAKKTKFEDVDRIKHIGNLSGVSLWRKQEGDKVEYVIHCENDHLLGITNGKTEEESIKVCINAILNHVLKDKVIKHEASYNIDKSMEYKLEAAYMVAPQILGEVSDLVKEIFPDFIEPDLHTKSTFELNKYEEVLKECYAIVDQAYNFWEEYGYVNPESRKAYKESMKKVIETDTEWKEDFKPKESDKKSTYV